MADKASVQVRELASRFESRIADPKFGGHKSASGEAYALAMAHAAQLARNLASDLEAENA